MDAIKLIVPAAAFLAMASALFGIVSARIIWADEATHAANMTKAYKKIHETDQETIAAMRRTIELLQSH